MLFWSRKCEPFCLSFLHTQTVIIFKAGLPINIAFTRSLQRDGAGFGPGDQAFCVTPHSKQQLKHLSRFPSMGFYSTATFQQSFIYLFIHFSLIVSVTTRDINENHTFNAIAS